MHRLLVLYSAPEDPAQFKRHYESTHLKLAAKLPGIRRSSFGYELRSLDGAPAYFCVFQADWDDEAAMAAALDSPEGRAVAADVPNYATGPVQLVHYDVTVLS